MNIHQILDRLKTARTRVRLHYKWGDTSTGYIGRSCGRTPVYLLVHNRRSWGGFAILTDAVVRIEHSNKRNGGTIWEQA